MILKISLEVSGIHVIPSRKSSRDVLNVFIDIESQRSCKRWPSPHILSLDIVDAGNFHFYFKDKNEESILVL
jgi:hypothetical protein